MDSITLVVAAALCDGAGRVLMQRRPAGKAHGGLWEFPGGKVEPDEHPQAALVREIREELGVSLRGRTVPLGFAQTDPDESRKLVLLLYGCEAWEGDPVPEPGASLAWFAPAELEMLEMPPLDVELVATVFSPRPKFDVEACQAPQPHL